MQATNHVVRHAGRSVSVHNEPLCSSVYFFPCKNNNVNIQSNVAWYDYATQFSVELFFHQQVIPSVCSTQRDPRE